MIISRWPAWFRDRMGGGVPGRYVVLDIETSGFDMKKDVVTEIGHCLVDGGRVVDRVAVLIDWTDHPVVDEDWLHDRLVGVGMKLSAPGRPYHVTLERMKEEGLAPARAFAVYAELLATFKAKGVCVAGHNHLRFDEPMLQHNVVGFGYGVAADFAFGENVFDVNAIERAEQMADDTRVLPSPGETPREYLKRLTYMQPKDDRRVLSNLVPFCAEKYNLAGRYGVDLDDAHRADHDAYLTHLVMETWRDLVAKADVRSPVARSEQPPGPRVPPVEAKAEVKTANAFVRRRRRGQRNR